MTELKIPKREAFAVAFTTIGDETFGNATKSAEKAGYSPDSARTTGWRLLKDVDVKARILELYDENLKDNRVTTQSVLANLAHDRLLARQAGQFSVAVRCSELEGKYLDMFKDKADPAPEKLDLTETQKQEAVEYVKWRTEKAATEPPNTIKINEIKTA